MEERREYAGASSPEQILNFSCELGRQLLQNGAEIFRVEDSLQRLLAAYGYAKAEIFAIPFCIILTIQEGDHNYTKSVRIQTVSNNLRRLNELNALCRALCRECPPMGESWWRLKRILGEPVYPPAVSYLAHGMVAAFFTLFWGGTWVDALLAFPCGLLVKLVVTVMRRGQINVFFTDMAACMVLALGPEILWWLGCPIHADRIIIGTTEDNGSVLEAGKVRHGGEGRTNIGMLKEDAEGMLPRIKESFAACGFQVKIHEQIQKLVWHKLFTNVSLSVLTGILQVDMGFIAENEHAWKLTGRLIHEAVEVANRQGLGFDEEEIAREVRETSLKNPKGCTSIRADLRDGRRTEVDTISGAVVEAARRLGMDVPYHEMAVELVHSMENRTV